MEAITGPPIMVGLWRRNQQNKVEGAKVNLMGNNGCTNYPAICLGDTGARMTDMVQGEQDLIMPTKSHYKKYK